jgi:hypothetical protein
MIVNYRVHRISRGARKLTRTPILIIIIKKKDTTRKKSNAELRKNRYWPRATNVLIVEG